jgi:hypothetical protein
MSRNQERVLSDAMITDIKAQLFGELEWSEERNAFIEAIMHAYLTDDWNSFKNFATDIIESYEDDILLILNMHLNEDSHDNI